MFDRMPEKTMGIMIWRCDSFHSVSVMFTDPDFSHR